MKQQKKAFFLPLLCDRHVAEAVSHALQIRQSDRVPEKEGVLSFLQALAKPLLFLLEALKNL